MKDLESPVVYLRYLSEQTEAAWVAVSTKEDRKRYSQAPTLDARASVLFEASGNSVKLLIFLRSPPPLEPQVVRRLSGA